MCGLASKGHVAQANGSQAGLTLARVDCFSRRAPPDAVAHLACRRNTLSQVKLSGPTLFTPIITAASQVGGTPLAVAAPSSGALQRASKCLGTRASLGFWAWVKASCGQPSVRLCFHALLPQIAGQPSAHPKYYVLLILTDGWGARRAGSLPLWPPRAGACL